jgi:hypothetical protein
MTNRNKPWDSETLEIIAWVGLLGAVVVCGTAFAVFRFHMESDTYNRLTGAHTTWWDAVWVELRVQESPRTNESAPLIPSPSN